LWEGREEREAGADVTRLGLPDDPEDFDTNFSIESSNLSSSSPPPVSSSIPSSSAPAPPPLHAAATGTRTATCDVAAAAFFRDLICFKLPTYTW